MAANPIITDDIPPGAAMLEVCECINSFSVRIRSEEEVEMKDLIARFQKERQEKRLLNLQRVAAVSNIMIICGLGGVIADFCLQFYGRRLLLINDTAAVGVFLVLHFLFISGTLLINTTMDDNFDADALLEGPEIKYVATRCWIALQSLAMSFPAVIFPPYFFGCLMALSALSLCVRSFGRFYCDRFTFKLGFYMICWVTQYFEAFLWGAIQYMSSANLDAMDRVPTLVSLPDHAKGRVMVPTYFFISAAELLLLVGGCWFIWTQMKIGINPAKVTIYCIYMNYTSISIYLISLGTSMIYFAANPPARIPDDPMLDYTEGFYPGWAFLVLGCEFLFPTIMVIILTPDWIFNYTASTFDRKRDTLERDGAFIAELLDHSPVRIQRAWHVHWDKAGLPKREEYATDDCRRFWYAGLIVGINTENGLVTVKLHDSEKLVQVEAKGSNSDSVKLLEMAHENLRCTDWSQMDQDLFVKSVRDADAPPCYSYSRPVVKNEIIDYFISHSWSDSGEEKYARLSELADWHWRTYGRYPTFWFDKTCIDQNSIGEGLKVLPVNVMACNFLLVLHGPTYCSRLWCIWELFTLFSFAPLDAAIERLKIMPLGTDEGNVMEKLLSFDVMQASCYDPNEENKLRNIIEINGRAEFNSRVRALGKTSLEREMKRSGKSN